MHVFVDAMQPCPPTIHWRWPEACHLLSDDLDTLKVFAWRLGLLQSWLKWGRGGTPYYDLTRSLRTRALLMGAEAISRREAGLLAQLWRRRGVAALARLRLPPPYNPNPF